MIAAGGWYGTYDLTEKVTLFVLGVNPKKLDKSNEQMGSLAGFGTASALVFAREKFFAPVMAEPPKQAMAMDSAQAVATGIVTYMKDQVALIKRFPFRHYMYGIAGHAVAFSVVQRVYNKTHMHLLN